MLTRHWAAVLGRPIGHSLSPVLHSAAYAALGLDWSYDAREVGEEELPAVLAEARADESFVGFSLTMPLKTAAVPLLDSLATGLGAVNTIVNDRGRLEGYNTDVDGVEAAIAAAGATATSTLLLGAGGTAVAAAEAVRRRGGSVTVASRRDTGLAGARWIPFADADPAAYTLVVSTTPAGATDDLASRPWPAEVPLVDVLYSPWPTALAAAAERAGAAVVGGREVLLGQAAMQVRLMTGLQPPVAAMRAALERA